MPPLTFASPPIEPALQRWRVSRLLSAPHRLAFFGAAVLMAATALWWAVMLVARWLALPMSWAVAQPIAHGLAMSLMFMPLFIVGFLFTAGPRWLDQPDVPARTLLGPVLALVVGWMVALVGFHVASRMAALGVATAATGWLVVLARFGRLVRASQVHDKLHARGVLLAGGLGAAAMAAAAVGVATEKPDLARAAVHAALWGFLAPTFTIVSHRMLPFFTAAALPFLQAWRPTWLLAALLTTLGVTGLAEVSMLLVWPWPASVHGAMAVLQGAAALLLLGLALRWGLLHSMRVRLLGMLHGGFVWLGVALALAAISHLRIALHGDAASLGLAPLHALTVGYLGATLIAMVTRVAAGHSGRPLVADDLAFGLYMLVQAAALLRVAAALWPSASTALTLVAALSWTAACVGWAGRYGSWLGRPRADGRPG